MATANYNVRLIESASGVSFQISRNSTTQLVDATSGAPNRVSATLDSGPNAPPVVKTISGATNATPIVLTLDSTTSLADGDWVKVSGVGGTTNANGIFLLTATSSPNTTLLGSAGNAAYTSGGTLQKLNLCNSYKEALARVMEAIVNDRSTQ